MESQESLLFNHMLPVKIRLAIPKLWQVEHEINNKIDIYEVVIVGPISCGDTECFVGAPSILIQTGAESWERFPVPRICRWESMSDATNTLILAICTKFP